MDLDSQLRAQVELAIGRSVPTAPVLKLKGDASNRSYYRVGTAPDDPVFNLPCESVPCFTSFSAMLPSAYAALIFAGDSSYSASFNSRFTSIILLQPQHPPLA